MATQMENESALVRKSQMGCGESFAVLVRRYERQIYRLSYALTGDAGDAGDVLQETFLKAYENIGRFRGESRFYTWLVSIAMNEATTNLRRRYPSGWVSLDQTKDADESVPVAGDNADWGDNPADSYIQIEVRAILVKALQSLEIPLRIVFALRDIDELSGEDTARALGLSVPEVKSRLMHARLKLREELSVWFKKRSLLAAR